MKTMPDRSVVARLGDNSPKWLLSWLRQSVCLLLLGAAAFSPMAQEQPAPAPAPADPAAAPAAEAPAAPRLTEAEREARRQARRAQRRQERQTPRAATVTTTAPSPQGAASAVAPEFENPPPEAAAAPAQTAVSAPTPAAAPVPAPAATAAASAKDPELRLNFRNAPLEMVLNYLSEAAGFTILLETSVRGTVDVWSNQPLSRAEAVELLNSVLNKNGYAAIQNGRTLAIVSKDDAKKRNLPVKSGSNPSGIPNSDEMVTQIMPVRFINAPQLVRDLQPLLPASATITANEGGNSILITDTQANIRRIAEILAALDTSVAGAGVIRVFALKYADAKALATSIKELFPDTSNSSRGGATAGGGPGGFLAAQFGLGGRGGQGGGGRGGTSSAQGPAETRRVAAVADEHSNSVIVSASEETLNTIAQLIESIDTDVQDLTELRVFPLKFSDPTEMADLLTNLFPDTTRTDQNRGGGFRFGGPGGFQGGGGGRNAATGDSDRKKLQGRVMAVPDPRTSSVVVSAAKELMPQIEAMIAQLDSNPAKKQKVFVYSLDNANVEDVETVLRDLFESQSSRSGVGGNQQNNALQNRSRNTQQQGLNNQGGIGGGGGGFGGNTGGGSR